MRIYKAFSSAAQALDQSGQYKEADSISKFLKIAADMNQMLQGVPGASYLTNPVNLQDTALGKQMGLTILPNRAFQGSGPDAPLELPQMQPGMTSEQYNKMMTDWYWSSQVQAWLKSRSSRIKAYADYIHTLPGLDPEVREQLYQAMMGYAQDAQNTYPNNTGNQTMPNSI